MLTHQQQLTIAVLFGIAIGMGLMSLVSLHLESKLDVARKRFALAKKAFHRLHTACVDQNMVPTRHGTQNRTF